MLTFLLVMVSCSKEEDKQGYTTPSNLVGTTWKCSTDIVWDEDIEYLILKFNSATVVEGWSKYKEVAFQRDWVGTYTIIGKTISIDEGDLKEKIVGTINGVTLNVANEGEVNYLTFTLQ